MDLKITNTNRVDALSTQRTLETHAQKIRKQSKAQGPGFLEALKQAHRDVNVRFSKHAAQRLNAWSQESKNHYIDELGSAMDIAQSKGARSTLVLMRGVAFVVAPQSRTVVTVIPEDRMKQSLFTSIDSAVLMDK